MIAGPNMLKLYEYIMLPDSWELHGAHQVCRSIPYAGAEPERLYPGPGGGDGAVG